MLKCIVLIPERQINYELFKSLIEDFGGEWVGNPGEDVLGIEGSGNSNGGGTIERGEAYVSIYYVLDISQDGEPEEMSQYVYHLGWKPKLGIIICIGKESEDKGKELALEVVTRMLQNWGGLVNLGDEINGDIEQQIRNLGFPVIKY